MTKPPALLSADNFPESESDQSTLSWRDRIIPNWIRSSKAVLLLSSMSLLLATLALLIVSTYSPVTPKYPKDGHQIHKPMTILLNQDLGSLPTNLMSITPKLEGSWDFEQGTILNGDQVTFTPKDTFKVNTEYVITFPTASRILGGEVEIDPIAFKTEKAPGLSKYGLMELKDDATIAADYVFEVKLTAANRDLRDLELQTEPKVDLTRESKDDTLFMWKSKDLLPQGRAIAFKLYDKKNNTTLLSKTISIAAEPTVEDLIKTNLYGATEPIQISFSQPVDPKFSSHISIDAEGEGSWADEKTYRYAPAGLEAGKTYTVLIKSGVRSKAGGILSADQTRTLTTVGPVSVLATSPHGSGLSQSSQTISFTFDQPVDHASVESRFGLSTGTVAGTSWVDNTFRVVVNNLGYQRTVTASIAAGVVNAGFGLPSTQMFSHSFTTEIRSARLNVPLYLQQHSGTCTAASLRMALAYKGVTTDEMTLVQRMGYNPKNMDKSTNPPIWDDPQLMFVGSIDGKIREGTGAGPDAPPVAKAAKTFGIDAEAVTGININWVAQQIYSNRPVIFFGAFDSTPEYISWNTPAGKSIKMNISSHARTIYGVQGEPTNPIGFWIHDPLYGSSYWSAGVLAHNITLDPDRQAVVIR